ncbi:hypothetical protein B7P34_06670 [Streptosporangium nondiastaticum]|uniref:Uncharacterized protein n=1 Tax=Streptosporangium nondiastaticum TaxID=35764 RepID=A0A9X7JTH7_9ACTN|nr:hypothetical protein [Streptosporangium nondiastaticum]PSJ29547.1 hypothetical protein B7P34_06670 [Streptosporangium nondiastaticum]
MTDPTPSDVALELEKLRGVVEVGFARADGALALLVQRDDQTDQRLTDLDSRVAAVERGRWPLPSLAALVSIAAVIVSVWQATTTH